MEENKRNSWKRYRLLSVHALKFSSGLSVPGNEHNFSSSTFFRCSTEAKRIDELLKAHNPVTTNCSSKHITWLFSKINLLFSPNSSCYQFLETSVRVWYVGEEFCNMFRFDGCLLNLTMVPHLAVSAWSKCQLLPLIAYSMHECWEV